MKIRIFFSVFAFTLLMAVSYAQDIKVKPAPTPSPKLNLPSKPDSTIGNKDKRNTEKESVRDLTPMQLRGVTLASEVAYEATQLEEKRSGALIQASLADVLWSQDKVKAGELFVSAFEVGTKYYQETHDDNQRKVGKSANLNRADVLLEVIRLTSKHDKQLAQALTDKYLEVKKQINPSQANSSTAKLGRLVGDNQAAGSGLWRMALSFIETDLKLSTEIAQRALAIALTPEMAIYLSQLAMKDRQLADQIYLQALSRIRTDSVPSPGQLTTLVDYPFNTGLIRFTDGQTNISIRYPVPQDFKRNAQLIDQLISTSIALISRVAESVAIPPQADDVLRLNTAFYLSKYLEPKVAEFQPNLLGDWRSVILRLTTTLEESARRKLEGYVTQDASSHDVRQSPNQQEWATDLLERAEKSPDIIQRDSLYARAALSLSQTGDSEKALQVVRKIVDLSLRGRLKSWISFQATEHALQEKKWDEAHKYAIEVDAIDERAYLLLQLAAALQQEKETVRAREILEESFRLALASGDSSSKVKVMIGIADNYAAMDFTRGFEVVEAAVKIDNGLSRTSNLAPDDTYLIHVLELEKSTVNSSKLFQGFDLGEALVKLAKHDVERSLSLLHLIDNLPLRYTAAVKLVGFLMQPVKKAKIS